MDTYVICKEYINNTEECAALGQKNTQGINTASEKRQGTITAVASQRVHQERRRL